MRVSRSILLGSTFLVLAGAQTLAADLDVPANTTVNQGSTVNVSGTNSVTVGTNGTLNFTAGNPGIAWNGVSAGVTVTNSGTMNAATGNRLIRGTGSLAGARNFTLTNNAGAVMSSNGDDTFQINIDLGNATSSTVLIENSGRIESLNGGQALDFDAIATASPNTTITINNNVGGVINAVSADAIRPGQAATVTNSGTICVGTYNVGTGACSGGVANESHDAVDWQGRAGTLINKAGGVISGQHHGTTSDVDVDVTNEAGGTIIGRNGSGVGSDGDGTVVNRGTIIGANNPTQSPLAGDGDGVDIDFNANIDNYGTIKGTGAHGLDNNGFANKSEGIAVGQGTITNRSGALVQGADMGINVDHDVVGHQTGAVAITNEGTIEGLNGLAIRIRGDFADTITNLGTISGTAGAIDMGGGDDMLKLGEGSSIAGLIDGGDGFDTIEILDPPAIAVHLGTNVNFERLLIDDDAILALDADQDFDVVLGVVFNPDGSVANIYGEGFNVYYDPNDPLNGYLLGGTYALQEGGLLLAAAPVPATLALLAPGVIGLGWFRRKKAADRGTA